MERFDEVLRWASWTVLALLFLALLFTKTIVEWLGMENTLQSVMIVIVPLVALAGGLEWMMRRLAK